MLRRKLLPIPLPISVPDLPRVAVDCYLNFSLFFLFPFYLWNISPSTSLYITSIPPLEI